MSGLLAAFARALPLCLALPLPGLAARAALAFVLAASCLELGSAAFLVEMGRGLALGFGVAAPLWAARWAGRTLGLVAAARAPTVELVARVLGWTIFAAAGGLRLLLEAYLRSYARWPVQAATATANGEALATLTAAGTRFFELAARLALPSLLVLALVELCAGLLARFEDMAVFDLGARRLGAAARPIVALLMLVASLGLFVTSIGQATREVIR